MKPSDLTNYDKITQAYIENTEKENSFNNIYERPYMLSIFDKFEGKTVLDLGCGTGFYSFYALEQKASVTSVDASRKMIDLIQKKDSAGKLRLVHADLAEGLPFLGDDSQDYIICSLVLHYLENWDKIIEDCRRVLRKSGKLYVSTHHPFSDYLYLKKPGYFDRYLVEDTWGSNRNPFKVHYYTKSLTDVLKPFFKSGLIFRNIEEPMPGLKCKEIDPDAYKKFLKKPAFLFLTLEK